MGKSQREKGKRGERLWRDWLKDSLRCTEARRGQQRAGTDQSDVIGGIPGTHPEVKFVESLNIHAALKQADEDAARLGLIPYVAYKRSNEGWNIAFRADNLLSLVRAVALHAIASGILNPDLSLNVQQPATPDPGPA